MSLGGAAARGALVTLGAQWIKFAVQLVALAVLARLLDPTDYGLIAMAAAFIGVANLIADFGLSQAAVQSQTITQGQKSNLFWLSVLLGAVLAGAMLLLAWPIAAFYGEVQLVPIIQVLSVLLFVGAASGQFRAEVSKGLRFRALGLADVVATVVSSALAIVLAVLGFGYWALVAQQLAMLGVQSVVLVIAARWAPSAPSREPMRALVTFGTNNLGTRLVNYVSENADNVILGRFAGPDAVGIYSRAYQLFHMPLQQLAAPLTRVAFPILSRLNGTPEFDRYIQRGQLLLTYLLAGVFFAAIGLASPIIDIVLGPDWSQAKPLFAILAVGGVFQSIGYVYYWIFLAKAMTGLQLRYAVISRSLMVALMLVGVLWGAPGVAAGLAVGLALNWLILTVFAIPRTGVAVRPLVVAALRPIGCYALMLAAASPVILLATGWAPGWAFAAIAGAMVAALALQLLLFRRVRDDLRQLVETARLLRRGRA